MSYDDWLKDIQNKLKSKYKIKKIYVSNLMVRIVFYNSFNFQIDKDMLETYYYLSVSDIMRAEDGFNFICNDIEKSYMQQLKR